MKRDCEHYVEQVKEAAFRDHQRQYAEKIAKAYLRQLGGYEAATNTLKNRYVYAMYAKAESEEMMRFEQSFREMEKRTNRIRKDIFQALRSMENKLSMTVLWMLYIEGKQVDEVAEQLRIPEWRVAILNQEGLRDLPVPEAYVTIYMRRHTL